MTTSYLEQLLDKYDSLELVISPPHPGAFIQGRTDQARILLAELEQEISEIEKQDALTFETITLYEVVHVKWEEQYLSVLVPVGFEPSLYSQSQEWQHQDNEVDLWQDYGFSRGSFA